MTDGLSFSDIQTLYLADTGNTGSTDTNLLAYFKLRLGTRYKTMLALLGSYINEKPKTATTVASQQFYHLPAGVINIEAATIQINTNFYTPLQVIDSLDYWNYLNQLVLTGPYPRAIFPRQDDFGLWPIPASALTITLNAHMSDRNLSVADYTTGTVSISQNSQLLTGVNTVWTAAMIGRYFHMNDETQQGQGKFYRIGGYSGATGLTLESSYNDTTVAGKTYRICQMPELPTELHSCLEAGLVADYYSGPKSDTAKATWFNNTYYTGDGNNNDRVGRNVKGGLLGAIEKYSGRSDSGIVKKRTPQSDVAELIPWATTVTLT